MMRYWLLFLVVLTSYSEGFNQANHPLSSNAGVYLGVDWVQIRGVSSFPPPGRTGQLSDLRVFNRPGASLGLFKRFWWREEWAFRPMAGLVFQDNAIVFEWQDRGPHHESVAGLSIYVPLLIEVHKRQLPTQPYAFAGPVYSYFWRQGMSSSQQLLLKNQELSINFGLGFSLSNDWLMLRPEISFNLGVSNLLRGAEETRYLQEVGRDFRRDFLSIRLLMSASRPTTLSRRTTSR